MLVIYVGSSESFHLRRDASCAKSDCSAPDYIQKEVPLSESRVET